MALASGSAPASGSASGSDPASAPASGSASASDTSQNGGGGKEDTLNYFYNFFEKIRTRRKNIQ